MAISAGSISEAAIGELPGNRRKARYGRIYSEPTHRGTVASNATHKGGIYASPEQGPNKP